MRIAITGSSGLIGTAVSARLRAGGHDVVPVVRREPTGGEIGWRPSEGRFDPADLRGIDGVINLAGAGIGDKRWNEERKRVILESRTKSTKLLADAMASMTGEGGPSVLLSGSAIGYYGDRGDEVLTESSGPGDDFLADLCVQWEAAAQPAIDAGVRTAFLLSGIVQSTEGGALAKTLVPFKLGLGGRLGSGQQWWSWISIDDEVGAIIHLLTSTLEGPVNLVAPNPVRNADYTKALGRALHRPTVIPTPSFAPRLLLGRELAEALLGASQRVEPAALVDDGFEFRHRSIDDCFTALLGDAEVA